MEENNGALVRRLGKHLSEVIAVDKLVFHTLAITLIALEIKRSQNSESAIRDLSESWSKIIDFYGTTGATPENLMEIDRQKGRDVADALLAAARLLLDRGVL